MSAVGETWVRHRMSCDRCAAFHGALPGARPCRIGERLYLRLGKDAGTDLEHAVARSPPDPRRPA